MLFEFEIISNLQMKNDKAMCCDSIEGNKQKNQKNKKKKNKTEMK